MWPKALAALKSLSRSEIFWCAIGMLACTVWLANLKATEHPDYADARQYISGGVNLAKYGTFNENIRLDSDTITPGIGREPGYAAVLSVVFRVGDSLDQITPTCLYSGGCGVEPYVWAKWTNRTFIVLSGLIMFFAMRRLTGSPFAAIMSGMHLWLNHQMHKNHDYVISDPLAMFLASLLVFTCIWAWQRKSIYSWITPGLVFAGLVFTKAVYIYFIPVAVLIGLVLVVMNRAQWKSSLSKLLIVTVVATSPLFLWMERNHDITGKYQFTDSRGGIALSTRVVFNDMNLTEYLAAFTYWTRGAGDGWAEALFPAEIVKPFEWYNPDGYYLRGQLGFGERASVIASERNIPMSDAKDIVEHQIKDQILAHPIKHIVTTLPLIYRGIWIDELAIITFPALIWLLICALRQRNGLLVIVLLPSLFSLVFYAAFSLNVARYQMTAMPGFAIAFGYLSLWVRDRIQRYRRHKTPKQEKHA